MSKVKNILIILVSLWLLSGIIANTFTIFGDTSNVVIIKINKPISTENSYDTISSSKIVSLLDSFSKTKRVILLEINSPGGSAVATKEIVDEIKRVKKNVSVISYIRDIGTSGAYWIASASDRIFANELSIVGGIGVISSYLDVSGLLRKYNISYERLVAGKYKDMGSPFRKLTSDEKKMFERQLNIIYEIFKRDVAKNRNITYETINSYADGKVYLGLEAKKLRLVDDIGARIDVLNYIQKEYNFTPKVLIANDESFLASLKKTLFSNVKFTAEESLFTKYKLK